MQSYIALDNAQINGRISIELDLLKGIMVEQYGDSLEGVILSGSFARGEGAVVMLNNEIIPLEPFAVVLVVAKELPLEKIRAMQETLNRKLRGERVLLRQKTYRDLPKLPLTPEHFLLKSAGLQLFGAEDMLQKMPARPAVFTPRDSETLLWNSLWRFMESAFPATMSPPEILVRTARLLNALARSMDAMLILEGKFQTRQKDRLDEWGKISEKYVKDAKLRADANSLLEWYLAPAGAPPCDLFETFDLCRRFVLNAFKQWALAQGIRFEDPMFFPKKYRASDWLRRYYHGLFSRAAKYAERQAINFDFFTMIADEKYSGASGAKIWLESIDAGKMESARRLFSEEEIALGFFL